LIVLRTAVGDQAVVSLDGAQLLSWQAAAREQLYSSTLSQPAPGRAVRGGVPVCFPQFAARGPLQKHGFARNHRWVVVEEVEDAADAVRLRLAPGCAPAAWPYAFALELSVRLGAGWVDLQLDVANEGPDTFDFTAALHTYFLVPDVRLARVVGLQGCWYEDSLHGDRLTREASGTVGFAGEVDRVYRNAPATLYLEAPGMPGRRITQAGFVDTVVWNPGPAKAATLGDMPAGDWLRMVCIEAAVAAMPIRLAPGRTWQGAQRIELSPD
jgi:glucose-6-phosphate 1-epimerase